MNRFGWILGGLLLTTAIAYGQDYSGDVFRYSEQVLTGTPRFQALGGNHTALGGDASNMIGNPAGVGFYNRSELSISGGARVQNVSGAYLGTTTTSSSTYPTLNHVSIIFANDLQGRYADTGGWKRSAFGFSYTKQVQLTNTYVYNGRNNSPGTTIAPTYLADVNSFKITGAQLDKLYDSNSQSVPGFTNQYSGIGLAAAAYQLYLVNPTSLTGTTYFGYDTNVPVQQRETFTSSGSQAQWTGTYAGNYEDKLYVGGSVGITSTNYTYSRSYTDQYVGGKVFNGLTESSDLTVSGTGFSLSLGAIYKVAPSFQVGVAVISPTWAALSETFNQSITINPIGIPQLDANGKPVTFIPNVKTVSVQPNDFTYSIQTPLRSSLGLTYFFGRRGFLTATAEYVGYQGMRVTTSAYQNIADNQAFGADQKSYVQQDYQNVLNVRVGAEVRAGVARFRAGVAYLPSAYKTSFDLLARNGNRDQLAITGGLGVRNDRFFADISGAYYANKFASAPPSLGGTGPAAVLTNQNTSIQLGVGLFF